MYNYELIQGRGIHSRPGPFNRSLGYMYNADMDDIYI